MKEPWYTHLVVFYFPLNSPLPQLFNPVIRRLREAGIIHKLIGDAMDSAARLAEHTSAETGSHSLTVGDLAAVLAGAAACLGSGLVAFVAEVVLASRRRHKQPVKALSPKGHSLIAWRS